jgi:hypothetical protein
MRLALIAAAVLTGALALPAAAQPPAPADYPHDMSAFQCSHRDEEVCDAAPTPPPLYTPLVGSWVRFSLLRNGFSVQPPDAPLYLQFMADGYWSMMEFPAGRPKVDKPLDQQTPQELFARFDKMSGGYGVYTNIGQVNYRHHKLGLTPGGENTQERAWRFEGNVLVLEGAGPTRSPQIHARKLPTQPLGTTALVGSWERTAYSVNGQPVAGAAPEHLLLAEDGWYQATSLPAGRTSPRGVDMKTWTTAQYVAAFGGMSASRGTYAVTANTLSRRHIGDVDPNLEGKLTSGTYTRSGDSFTWTGTDAQGRTFVATYVKMKPFDIYAPLPRPGPAGG